MVFKKNRFPPPTGPTCYIQRLPPEIASLICHSIHTRDVLNLRLVSTFWNNVATPFFPRHISIVFKPESFRRLLDISRHPVISKQITSLYYEPNTLRQYVKQGDWEAPFIDDSYFQSFEAVPPPDASERRLRAYRRNIAKISERPTHSYSRSQLSKGYKEYTRMHAEQEDLRNKGYGLKEFSDAMSRLPNLSKVCMNHGWGIYQRPEGARNAFATGLTNAGTDYCGIPFMLSLLRAVHEAGIKLVTLQLGDVDWKFLKQSHETLECMKNTLRYLTTLKLAVSTGMDESGNEIGVEIPICRKYLCNNKRLAEFLAAAPALKDLAITFDWYEPFCPAELNQIFGDTVWPCLESIALENIDATFDHWVYFFEQHASTLKHVTIKTIVLLDGTWVHALEKMSKILNLKSVYARGDLIGKNPPQHWDLEPDIWAEYSDFRSQKNQASKTIQNYLIESESCPLLDRLAYPQR